MFACKKVTNMYPLQTADAVEKRWKTLRDCYGKAIKPPESGAPPKELSNRTKYIVDKLSFLEGHMNPRNPTTSNLPPVQTQPTENAENAPLPNLPVLPTEPTQAEVCMTHEMYIK